MEQYYVWAEELPDNCPPNDAIAPSNQQFYRLVEQIPPTDKDFFSHRKLYPEKKFREDECIVRSISIFASREECLKIKKLPVHKQKAIISITLTNSSGMIKRTGSTPSHHSWWRCTNFNPLSNYVLLE